MTENEKALREALQASDLWLRFLVERLEIDADATSFDVKAVSRKDQSSRNLASSTLSERLSKNKTILEEK